MERNVKKVKNNSGENVRSKPSLDKVDRLSSLPDALLLYILSFVPTQKSVSTSILARRYRYLWTQVPALDFDFRSNRKYPESLEHDFEKLNNRDAYRPPTAGGNNLDAWRDIKCSRMVFSDSVHRVLLDHQVHALDTFRVLYRLYDFTDFQLHTFISFVIEKGVKCLDIDCDREGKFHVRQVNKVPSSLFCFSTLVKLRLIGCYILVKSGSSVNLSSLKELHLKNIQFGDDETFVRIISGCPILKELFVNDFDVRFLSDSLSLSKLLYLTLEIKRAPQGSLNCPLKIFTPSLKHLTIKGGFPVLLFAPSLLEAHIEVHHFMLDCGINEGEVFNVLNSLHEIKSLSLSCDIQFGESSLGALTTQFRKLKRLCFDGHRDFLFNLIDCADNLEDLLYHNTFEFHEDPVNKERRWLEPIQGTECLLSQVINIEYVHTAPMMIDLPVIEYLLKNAMVLNSMIIRTDPGYKLKFDALQKVSSFKRGSIKCGLVFK